MDLVTLKDLPIPLAAIILAFYLINQNNAEFAKKLVAMVSEFTGKYEALLKDVVEEREAARARWLERDRQLIETLNRCTVAQEKNANETHQLRNMVTPLVLSVEAERRRNSAGGGQSPRRPTGGDSNAAD